MRKLVIISILSILSLVACVGMINKTPESTVSQSNVKEQIDKPMTSLPVVIDTDMAPDDWMAILFLLQSPEVDVQAITVTGAGEAHCGPGVKNALGLLALAGRPDIPVACGRETPLKCDHTFPTSWRQSVDNLMGLELPENANSGSELTAVELLTQTISSSPTKVALLTLGPLTNVAEALQASPFLVENIETVAIMGGAVDAPGNLVVEGHEIDNHTAEWNIYVDPHAARIVFESGAPITLAPLDATNQAPMTVDFYRKLKKNRDTPEAGFVFDVLSAMYDMIENHYYYFWDPLAAAVLVDDGVVRLETRKILVIEEEGPESGRTKSDENGFPVQMAISADRERFEQLFLDTLNGH